MKSIKIMAAAIALCGMTACGDNTPKTFTGFITDASMNTVTVENAEGTFTFSTMDADKSEANGLLLGAPVVVDYKGKLEDGAAAAKVATDPTYAEAVGKWTMPDPIDPEGVMGIEILIEGQARSINMATLRYTSWEPAGRSRQNPAQRPKRRQRPDHRLYRDGYHRQGRRRRIHADHRGQQGCLHQSDQIASAACRTETHPRSPKRPGIFHASRRRPQFGEPI